MSEFGQVVPSPEASQGEVWFKCATEQAATDAQANWEDPASLRNA
jgi:hypothetical protein